MPQWLCLPEELYSLVFFFGRGHVELGLASFCVLLWPETVSSLAVAASPTTAMSRKPGLFNYNYP